MNFFIYNTNIFADKVNSTSILCNGNRDEGNGKYMAIFMIGQLFNAFGGTTINLLAVPMIDENVKMSDLPLYSGMVGVPSQCWNFV